MERRGFNHGSAERSKSVRVLGQMFEELSLFAEPECHGEANTSLRRSASLRGVWINNNFAKNSKTKEERANCTNCNKPSVSCVDGTHVKNRKQFFEGHVQPTKQARNVTKPKTEFKPVQPPVTYRYSTRTSPKEEKFKEQRLCDVKSKKQLFEEYINANGNTAAITTKPAESRISKRPTKFNGYLGKKGTSMGDLSNRRSETPPKSKDDKKYYRRYSYEAKQNPTRKPNRIEQDAPKKESANEETKDNVDDETPPPPVPDNFPTSYYDLLYSWKKLRDDKNDNNLHVLLQYDPPSNSEDAIEEPISNTSGRNFMKTRKEFAKKYGMYDEDDDVIPRRHVLMSQAQAFQPAKIDYNNVLEEDNQSQTYGEKQTAEISEGKILFNTTKEDEDESLGKCLSPEIHKDTMEIIEDQNAFNTILEEVIEENTPSNVYYTKFIVGDGISDFDSKNGAVIDEEIPSHTYGTKHTAEVFEDKHVFNATQDAYEVAKPETYSSAFNAMHTIELVEKGDVFTPSNIKYGDIEEHNSQKHYGVLDESVPSHRHGTKHTLEISEDQNTFQSIQEDHETVEQTVPTQACNTMHTSEISEIVPSHRYGTKHIADIDEDPNIFQSIQEDHEAAEQKVPTQTCNTMHAVEISEGVPTSRYGTKHIAETDKDQTTFQSSQEATGQKIPIQTCYTKDTAEIIEDDRTFHTSNLKYGDDNSSKRNYGVINEDIPLHVHSVKHAVAIIEDEVSRSNVLSHGSQSKDTAEFIDDANALSTTDDDGLNKDDYENLENKPVDWCGTKVPEIIAYNSGSGIRIVEIVEDDPIFYYAQEDYDQVVPLTSQNNKSTAEITENGGVFDSRNIEYRSGDYDEKYYGIVEQQYHTKTSAEILEDDQISTTTEEYSEDEEQNISSNSYDLLHMSDVVEESKTPNVSSEQQAIYEDIPSYRHGISSNAEAEEEDTILITLTPAAEEDEYEEVQIAKSNKIEDCISEVTEAFESIQTPLQDQPKWTVWDVARDSSFFTDTEQMQDDYDIFGSLLDIENDYCVETFNSGDENLLFRLSIGREVLMHGEDEQNVYNEVDVRDKVIEDQEYYPIGNESYEDEMHMSGTFFDKNKNARIEIIGSSIRSKGVCMPQLQIPKVQYMIIKELIDGEENYLKRMKYIIDNYLIHFRNMDVSPDIEMVFGNIEEIYDKTEDVYNSLKNSVSVDEIARVFLTNVCVFDCYTEYLRSRRKSQQYASNQFAEIIRQRQLELEDQYSYENYLVNIPDRPEQYKIVLERLNKAVTKSGETCQSLEEAIILIERKMAEARTVLAIDSIRYPPSNLQELGTFIMKEKFIIKNRYTSIVFLFQGGVVFCVEDQLNPDSYEFIECIEMDKLMLKHRNTSTSFQLSCFDKSKKYGNDNDFDIEAPSLAVKERWVDEIQRILWTQLQYYKDQQKRASSGPAKLLGAEIVQGQTSANDFEVNSEDTNGENEYCSIGEGGYNSEDTKMSVTFFDKYENPRIEILRPDSQIDNDLNLQGLPKGQYMIIKELISTERTYLEKMKHLIESYYTHFKQIGAPSDISIVFGNIEEIHDETEKLYYLFLRCSSVDHVARVFIENADIFDLYTEYMRNKSKAYHYASTKFKDLIKERQAQLEDQYTCDSYLLNPVQRPGRYKLLLEKLQKELNKSGQTCPLLSEAVKLVSDKISEANTLMTIDSINKSPVDLKKMGPFIMKETFNIKKKYKSVIFLFRDIVVFCVEDPARSDTYNYVDSIEMTELSLSHNRNSTTFQLRNFNKSKLGEESKSTFDIEAQSMLAKQKWIEEIQRLLWSQLQYFKDQQKRSSALGIPSPLVRKNSMKTKKKPYDSPTKRSNRSTFYYDIH